MVMEAPSLTTKVPQYFTETVSALSQGFLMLFGIIPIIIYSRHTTSQAMDDRSSRLFGAQLFFTICIPILAVMRYLLQALVFKEGNIHSYMVLSLMTTLIIFPLSSYLSTRGPRSWPWALRKGHGFVLLISCALIFAAEKLFSFNFDKEGVWLHLKQLQDWLEMTMLVGSVTCAVSFLARWSVSSIRHQFETLKSEDEGDHNDDEEDEKPPTIRELISKVRKLLWLMWPRESLATRLCMSGTVAVVAAGRVVSLLIPIYSKKIIDSISPGPNQYFCWDLVVIYMFFKLLQGNGGVSGFMYTIRSLLWTKMEQYVNREMKLKLFSHLHDLPLGWHMTRKTGEVLRIMDRGTESVSYLLWDLLFHLAPSIFDILVAVAFFITTFGAWFGLIVIIVMAIYVGVTVVLTNWRTRFQRRMNAACNRMDSRAVDSLLNYETVKYYGAEAYEAKCFRDAIKEYQKEEFLSDLAYMLLNATQNIIICGGFLGGTLLAVHMVVNTKQLTIGDYVLVTDYIIELFKPLDFISQNYRQLQKEIVEMDKMFEVLAVESEVKDAAGAGALQPRGGGVEFRHVSFSYGPERPVLRDVSFTVEAGTTVAIVGPSGAGKSTIMRLLFRFYDVTGGAVLVDGRDVRDVTQASLRARIGVVPQDTVLFNNSIRYNIQYGNQDASEEEIIAAAKSADIYDKILTFSDGFDTKVSERGLRLSGGEKQRVAIARTMLKSPAMILLDEATSALDSGTERRVQAALRCACAGRGALLVAHRLSTVTHAQQILVLDGGRIVERGNHETLLARGGLYASMWHQQLKNRSAGKEGDSNDHNSGEGDGNGNSGGKEEDGNDRSSGETGDISDDSSVRKKYSNSNSGGREGDSNDASGGREGDCNSNHRKEEKKNK